MKNSTFLLIAIFAVTLHSAHMADITNYEAFGSGLACINSISSIPGHMMVLVYGVIVTVWAMAHGGGSFFVELVFVTIATATTISVDYAI